MLIQLLAMPLLLVFSVALAADDLLEEAAPMKDMGTTPQKSALSSPFEYRAYLLAEYQRWWVRNKDGGWSAPNLEAGLTGKLSAADRWQLYLDGTGTFTENTGRTRAVLGQAGIRYAPAPSLQLNAGKERTRKSPGLIVSPGDFIHAGENLPGLREQRTGTWNIRVSWQSPVASVDAMALPLMINDEYGIPVSDGQKRGGALRAFLQYGVFDAALSGGIIDGGAVFGAHLQAFALKALKLYAEAGFQHDAATRAIKKENTLAVLVGARYEGVTDMSFTAEVYRNGAGLTGAEPGRFAKTWYAIASASHANLWRESSLTLTHIQSLEENSCSLLGRYQLPFGAMNTAGVTLGATHGAAGTQYGAGVPSWTLAADWRISI